MDTERCGGPKELTRLTGLQLDERHFLFEVRSTKQPSGPDDKLITLFQLMTANDALKTIQMVHIVQSSHDQVRRRDCFKTSGTFCRKQPETEAGIGLVTFFMNEVTHFGALRIPRFVTFSHFAFASCLMINVSNVSAAQGAIAVTLKTLQRRRVHYARAL